MHISKIKNILALASVLTAWGPNIAGAHDQVGSLLDAASATDLYLITCSTDSGGVSDLLEIELIDPTTTAGGGKISAVIQKDTTVRTTSDAVRADTNFSPAVSISRGNTSYYVTVHKLKTGLKSYTLSYHCKNNNGSHTGTSLVTLQNE